MIDATQATEEEAKLVVERIKAAYKAHHGHPMPSAARYLSGFEVEDLESRLEEIRAQRASEARTATSQASGPDTRCHDHHEPLPCRGCKGAPKPVLVSMLRKYGPNRRPDIARRLDALTGANA